MTCKIVFSYTAKKSICILKHDGMVLLAMAKLLDDKNHNDYTVPIGKKLATA